MFCDRTGEKHDYKTLCEVTRYKITPKQANYQSSFYFLLFANYFEIFRRIMYGYSSNQDIMYFAPPTWLKTIECGEIPVERNTEEFEEVEADLLKAIKNAKSLKTLTRIQNVYTFGQFLMRSQILVISDSISPLYKVRRYVALYKEDRTIALEYNLDHRRLKKSELVYSSHLNKVFSDWLVFVVKILSRNATDTFIVPEYFTDYYIEYVAEMEVN